jgi:thioredoxin-related protein
MAMRATLALVFAAALGLAAAATRAGEAPALELVMVERAGCAWCVRWNAEVAPIYPKTPEGARAPLRRHDLANGQPATAAAPVRYTPTFLLLREGREIGRITGYQDDATFWGLLSGLMRREDAAARG